MVMRADCGFRLRKENRQPRYRRRRRAIGVAELNEAELCSVLHSPEMGVEHILPAVQTRSSVGYDRWTKESFWLMLYPMQ
jgi:hypothetical protein